MMCLLLMILRNVDLWCDLQLKRRKIIHEPPHKYKEALKKNMHGKYQQLWQKEVEVFITLGLEGI